jgi:hypothetical protein
MAATAQRMKATGLWRPDAPLAGTLDFAPAVEVVDEAAEVAAAEASVELAAAELSLAAAELAEVEAAPDADDPDEEADAEAEAAAEADETAAAEPPVKGNWPE